ncbi:unnamed protein product [Cuscuta epithymum]|uniref:Uncharacterized protein n=1 Tax=Cuscuta epithymum TaxID=186058 RepID=A0AAV0FSY6_9ASTE|nr:unnamed protein product [Cuscuta epithymum]
MSRSHHSFALANPVCFRTGYCSEAKPEYFHCGSGTDAIRRGRANMIRLDSVTVSYLAISMAVFSSSCIFMAHIIAVANVITNPDFEGLTSSHINMISADMFLKYLWDACGYVTS